jgi:hypothetical protein
MMIFNNNIFIHITYDNNVNLHYLKDNKEIKDARK